MTDLHAKTARPGPLPSGRRTPRLPAALAATALVALGLALAAAAAGSGHPKVAELRISKSRLVLAIDFQPPPGESAQAMRASFDRDRSGQLDRLEQERLLAYLARQASSPVKVELDGVPLPLVLVAGSVQGQNIQLPVSSTAQISVRLELEASLPVGKGDYQGRRKLVYSDEPPGREGHIPVHLVCQLCEATDPSSGRPNHGPQGDEVLAGEVTADAPFSVKLRLR